MHCKKNMLLNHPFAQPCKRPRLKKSFQLRFFFLLNMYVCIYIYINIYIHIYHPQKFIWLWLNLQPIATICSENLVAKMAIQTARLAVRLLRSFLTFKPFTTREEKASEIDLFESLCHYAEQPLRTTQIAY